MEEKIMQIIEKVRSISKYNPDIKQLVRADSKVTLVEFDGELMLESISFSCYDTLIVTQHSITLILEHGTRKVLFKYDGWNGLLEM